MTAIKEYLENYELIKRVKETAIKDFAGRVGIDNDDPRIFITRLEEIDGTYYIDLAFDDLTDPRHPFTEGSYIIQIINNKIAIREINYRNANERYVVRMDYNDYGILVSRVAEGEKLGYDAQGNQCVVERYRKEATEIDQYGTVREERTQGEKLQGGDLVIERYETITLRDERGTIMEEITHGEKLDLNGMVTELYTRTATLIDDYGTILEERTEGVVFGERDEAIGFYLTESRYDEHGILVDQYSGLLIPNTSDLPGIETFLYVEYKIDEYGNIVYTHVYDASGNEIPELSGESYKEPGSIIVEFVGEMQGKEDNLADLYKSDPGYEEPEPPRGDTDALQRREIELQLQALANDPSFIGQMADEKDDILSLTKGK